VTGAGLISGEPFDGRGIPTDRRQSGSGLPPPGTIDEHRVSRRGVSPVDGGPAFPPMPGHHRSGFDARRVQALSGFRRCSRSRVSSMGRRAPGPRRRGRRRPTSRPTGRSLAGPRRAPASPPTTSCTSDAGSPTKMTLPQRRLGRASAHARVSTAHPMIAYLPRRTLRVAIVRIRVSANARVDGCERIRDVAFLAHVDHRNGMSESRRR
jgi:hypothetical protein